MAGLANAIDFVREEMLPRCVGGVKSASKKDASTSQSRLRAMLQANYAVITMIMLYTHDVALIQWRTGWSYLSFSYFMGSCFEFIGLFSLALKVHSNNSVAGISRQSVLLFVTSLTFRLFTTMVFEGYLPVDRSGDHMVQLMDSGSLCSALYLIYAMYKKYADTYQEEADEIPVGPILASCAICSCFIRGVLNRNGIFDSLWAFSLNVEVFQLLPQLFMIAKIGGVVDTATAHFVVNIVLACLCRFVFWIWAIPGCKELSSPEGYSWNMAMGGLYILTAYTLQTLISLDFMYYYVKAWWFGQKTFSLPEAPLSGPVSC